MSASSTRQPIRRKLRMSVFGCVGSTTRRWCRAPLRQPPLARHPRGHGTRAGHRHPMMAFVAEAICWSVAPAKRRLKTASIICRSTITSPLSRGMLVWGSRASQSVQGQGRRPAHVFRPRRASSYAASGRRANHPTIGCVIFAKSAYSMAMASACVPALNTIRASAASVPSTNTVCL